MQGPQAKFNIFIGAAGLVLGLIFIPYLFEGTFAITDLRPGEKLGLSLLSFALTVYSFSIFIGKIESERLTLLLLPVIALCTLEFMTRVMIQTSPKLLKDNIEWAGSTYPDQHHFKAHPFLQFTGPQKAYRGFPTKKPLKKKEGLRIIALGGSTTASGYPQELQELFDSKNKKAEVLNLGQAYYTSTHTMINYFLNVKDLKPDYIIIHQGWNDNVVRNSTEEFRSDYAHALKTYEVPFIMDKYLIRASALYRLLKSHYTPNPSWRFIDSNLKIKRPYSNENYNDLSELEPFKRNIDSIILDALSNKTKVILTTQPFMTVGKSTDEGMGRHVEQCNQIMRELSRKRGVTLVDLHEKMNGKYNELFTDFGHLTKEGRKLKAELILEVFHVKL